MTGDFIFSGVLKKGNKGQKVRFAQGLLALHRIYTAIDGSFGSATEFAVKGFQKDKGIPITGEIDKKTFDVLLAPFTRAMTEIPPAGRSLGQLVLAYGEQHHSEHPREVGGENMGPWVKLYMKGNEGPGWLWCAGFVCFILEQACKSLHLPLLLGPSFSCDSLAAHAKAKGIFLSEAQVKAGTPVTPGSFFLSRRTRSDWNHVGIVIDAQKEILLTLEGNTNDGGSSNGYEVCKRIRGYKNKDFITI